MFLFVTMVTVGLAQQGQGGGGQRQQGTPEERAQRSVDMMEKSLALNAEQKTKIYTASLERGKAIDVLRKAAGEGNRPDGEKMKALNDSYEKVVAETLTADQKKKYEEMRAQRGGGNGPPRPAGNQ